MSLKRSKVNSSEEHALEMLDPFVQLLIDCLKSMDVKVQFWAEVCSVCCTKKFLPTNVILQLTCKRGESPQFFKPALAGVQIKLFEDM